MGMSEKCQAGIFERMAGGDGGGRGSPIGF